MTTVYYYVIITSRGEEMNVNKYFVLAKNASTFSDYNKIHIGAVLVYKNKVLSVGWNTKRTSPMQNKYNKYRVFTDGSEIESNATHAEMSTLIATKYMDNVNWDKCSLFVYSEKKNGGIRLTSPCSACRMALKERGIDNIYYTNNYGGYTHERKGRCQRFKLNWIV